MSRTTENNKSSVKLAAIVKLSEIAMQPIGNYSNHFKKARKERHTTVGKFRIIYDGQYICKTELKTGYKLTLYIDDPKKIEAAKFELTA